MPTDIRFFLFDGLKNDVRQMLLTHALYHDPSTSIHGNEALLFNFNHYSNGIKIKRITLLIYLFNFSQFRSSTLSSLKLILSNVITERHFSQRP